MSFRNPDVTCIQIILIQRTAVCKEFIEALEACHARGFFARMTGECNEQKRAMDMCFRREVGFFFTLESLASLSVLMPRSIEQRLEMSRQNREAAKERRKKWDDALAVQTGNTSVQSSSKSEDGTFSTRSPSGTGNDAEVS